MLRNVAFGLLLLCAALLAQPAHAVESDVYCLTGSTSVPGTPWQPVSSTNPCPVTVTSAPVAFGFDNGAVAVTATPNSSSHAAGSSIGGLFTVPIARIAGGSGLLANVNWKSTGGATTQLLFRIWQKNPVNTTCTDQTAFAGSDTDDAFLITSPFTMTPAAPASTTGDAYTYANLSNLTFDYKNVDTIPSVNLYVCVLTTATDTADESKLVRLTLSGPEN